MEKQLYENQKQTNKKPKKLYKLDSVIFKHDKQYTNK